MNTFVQCSLSLQVVMIFTQMALILLIQLGGPQQFITGLLRPTAMIAIVMVPTDRIATADMCLTDRIATADM